MKYYEQARAFISRHMIASGVGVAVVVACVLTLVSMWAYNVSDVARLDVSRPGYEKVREEVKKSEDTKKFNAAGALDKNALQDFQDLYDERLKNLNELGRFDGNVLDDDQLKLAAPAPQQPQ
jgi:hypothetical protein